MAKRRIICRQCLRSATIFQEYPEIDRQVAFLYSEQITEDTSKCEVHDLHSADIIDEIMSWPTAPDDNKLEFAVRMAFLGVRVEAAKGTLKFIFPDSSTYVAQETLGQVQVGRVKES
jgi:hypothetical protein